MIIVQNVDRIFSIKGPSFQILVFILFCFHLQRFLWYKVITLKVNTKRAILTCALSIILTRVADVIRIFYLMSASPRT